MGNPMDYNTIVRLLSLLDPQERAEIWNYYKESGVYFIGCRSRISIPADVILHIAFRYEPIRTLGRGTYGEVLMALDHKTKMYVAIKAAFPEGQRALLNEFKWLSKLNELYPYNKKYVLQVYDYIIYRGNHFMVEEILGKDLWRSLKELRYGLSLDVTKHIAYSTLKGLCLLKSADLVHCDVKPGNIAVIGDCVKLIDFGLTQRCTNGDSLTGCTQTFLYRAPEVILEKKFSHPIDMWSVGCVVAELILGGPIFQGEDNADQLAAIIEVIGLPPQQFIVDSPVVDNYFKFNRISKRYVYCTPSHRMQPGARSLDKIFETFFAPTVVCFLKQCLVWEPAKRITPKQALNHKWFGGLLPRKIRFIIALVLGLFCFYYLIFP